MHPPRFGSVLVSAAGVVAAGLVAYANSLGGPFLFDDILSIAENPTIRHLFSWDIFRPPSGLGLTVEGRPLLNASFALNHALGGLEVRGYHATNVAIHVIAALALLGGVHRTLRLPVMSAALRDRALPLATVIAMIWMLHPLQTESVTYTVQRAEALMGAWVLGAIYAFVRGAEPGGHPRWFVAAVVAAWGGALSKEVAAITPVLALLHDRTFLAGSFSAAWRARARVHLALASSWIITAGLVMGSGNRGGTVGFGSNVAWSDYALTQFESVARYLGLAVWPHPLVFDYGTPWVQSAARIAPAIALVLAVVAGTLVALRRWPAAGFLGAFFLGPLAPTSLIPGNRQTMAEHRMYLPLVAVVVLGTVLAHALLPAPARRARMVLAALVVTGFAGLTLRRNRDYQSELALFRDTVAKRPDNAFARYNLGISLAESGAPAAAVEEYRAAIAATPSLVRAHYNLGNALAELGRPREAEAAYREALRWEPRHARASYNLGNLLVESGRRAEAVPAFVAAVRAAPDFLDARINLGGVLLELGRLDEARRELLDVLARADSPAVRLNLGQVYRLQGDLAAARREFAAALRLDPGFAPAAAALRQWPEPAAPGSLR